MPPLLRCASFVFSRRHNLRAHGNAAGFFLSSIVAVNSLVTVRTIFPFDTKASLKVLGPLNDQNFRINIVAVDFSGAKSHLPLASAPIPLYPGLMRHISLPALKIALADLFDKRIDALLASNAGKTYEPVLRDKKDRIDALPEAMTGGRPLAEAMTELDDQHDGFGAALWYITEAYLRCPDVSTHTRKIIERIRSVFIPELEVIRAPYADEVEAALRNKNDLAEFESDLKAIPLAEGKTLYDWCVGFIAKGEQLGQLLSQRADLSAISRVEASKIRAATVGTLGRLRAALADEMSVNPDLPADLEAQIFGYFDELDQMAADAAAARRRPSQMPPPAEPT